MGPLIVHPLFHHTLNELPEALPRTPKHDLVPQDVLLLIAGRAQTARELCVLQRVSKRYRAAASDEDIWKRLCLNSFPVAADCNPPSWQELYRFHHEFLYKFLLSLKAEQYRMGFGVFGPANMVGMGIAINV